MIFTKKKIINGKKKSKQQYCFIGVCVRRGKVLKTKNITGLDY